MIAIEDTIWNVCRIDGDTVKADLVGYGVPVCVVFRRKGDSGYWDGDLTAETRAGFERWLDQTNAAEAAGVASSILRKAGDAVTQFMRGEAEL